MTADACRGGAPKDRSTVLAQSLWPLSAAHCAFMLLRLLIAFPARAMTLRLRWENILKGRLGLVCVKHENLSYLQRQTEELFLI